MGTTSVKDRAKLFERKEFSHPEAERASSTESRPWNRHQDASPAFGKTSSCQVSNREPVGKQHTEDLPHPLPVRTHQSTDGKLQSSGKRPPPVPSKSSAVLKTFESLHISAGDNPPELPRRSTTNIPVVQEDESLISSVDSKLNDEFLRASPVVPQPNTEHSSLPRVDSDDGLGQIKRGITDFGSKVSQTVNPLLNNTRDSLDKVAVAAKPVVTEAGRGLRQVGVGAKAFLDKTGVSTAFVKTQDDVTDAAAKLVGNSGLCSKCRQLPVDVVLSEEVAKISEPDFEWATPLMRVIYHAHWCRLCRLLLDVLCEAQNDPLKHPAVRPVRTGRNG